MEVYLVGGAVRDELLGMPVGERDWVVVGSSPEEMLRRGYRQVGKNFPVFLHPDTGEEYALARTERKKGRGYYGFEVHASPDVSLQDDLLRRDLTVNAMAKSRSGEIIDPYGGQQDLKDRLLRHVSVAFSEDPLRILRVARFAARFAGQGFTIADETMQLLHGMVRTGELKHIAAERVWEETQRALATRTPGVFFSILHCLNATGQVFAGIGDAFSSGSGRSLALAALEGISLEADEPCVRFAALIGGLYFHEHETARRDVSKLVRLPGLPNPCRELLELTVKLQHACHDAPALDAPELLDLLHRLDERRKPERFDKLLSICSVIFTTANQSKEYPQADWLRRASRRIEDIDVRQWTGGSAGNQEIADRLELARLESLREMIRDENPP